MNQWPKLVRFLDHPEACVDNNYLENQIRPFAQGRRVWLFAQTQPGARASANLYSLVSWRSRQWARAVRLLVP